MVPLARTVITAPIAHGFQIGTGNTGARQIVATSLAVGLSYLYFVVCEATRGATFGKQACRLGVVTVDGRRPSYAEAAKRNAFMLVSLIPATIGGLLTLVACLAVAVTMARSADGRGVHDRWAGLVVTARD